MIRFSVVYYSSGQLSEPLHRYCLEVLAKAVSASEGEVLCVTWEPLHPSAPASHNIVWSNHELTHRNMYEQILAGVSEAQSDSIVLAEHDVLYPRGYHEAMVAANGAGLCYNTNVWCLNSAGFFRPGNYHLLSNCGGRRGVLVDRIQGKLSEIRVRGGVEWAEPLGDVEISSPYPTVDIRHGRNFTGHREAPEGRYMTQIEYWGSSSSYTPLFTLPL